MQGGDGRCHPELELKAPSDIGDDSEHGNGDGPQSGFLKILSDGRPDLVRPLHHKRIIRQPFRKDILYPLSHSCLAALRPLQANHDAVSTGKLLRLTILQAAPRQQRPDLAKIHRLTEFKLNRGTAGKVNPEIRRTSPDLNDRDNSQETENSGNCERNPPPRDKIDRCLTENLNHAKLQEAGVGG